MILSIAIGSLAMRIKGADFYWRGEKMKNFLFVPFKGWSAIVFALGCALHFDPIQSVLFGVAWLFGIMPGLPALGEIKVNNRSVIQEVCWRGLWNGFLLSLFGFWTFGEIALAPMLAGLSMPLWYKIGFSLERKWPETFQWQSHIGGWALGEWLFGAALITALVTYGN
jgi:hypothetical protein